MFLFCCSNEKTKVNLISLFCDCFPPSRVWLCLSVFFGVRLLNTSPLEQAEKKYTVLLVLDIHIVKEERWRVFRMFLALMQYFLCCSILSLSYWTLHSTRDAFGNLYTVVFSIVILRSPSRGGFSVSHGWRLWSRWESSHASRHCNWRSNIKASLVQIDTLCLFCLAKSGGDRTDCCPIWMTCLHIVTMCVGGGETGFWLTGLWVDSWWSLLQCNPLYPFGEICERRRKVGVFQFKWLVK